MTTKALAPLAEIIPTEDDLMENMRRETLAEDIINQLRPSLPHFTDIARRLVQDSLRKGFDRNVLQNGLAVFVHVLGSFIRMAEDALTGLNTPKGRTLRGDLEAVKELLVVFAKTLERTILEKPVLERQMTWDGEGEI